MGKIADALALILACTTANDALVNYSRYVPGCRSRYLEIPHCPDGKKVLHVCLPSRLHNCGRRSGQLQWVHAAETFCEFRIAPTGFSHILRVCLQGGGVFVQGGSVTFDSCTIAGNTATYVRAHPQNFP